MPRRTEHLWRRDGVYYFRHRIPDDLRPLLGKREFKVSLKTTVYADAARRVGLERLKAYAAMDEARRQLGVRNGVAPVRLDDRTFTDADLWSLITTWFIQSQKVDDAIGPSQFDREEADWHHQGLTDPEDTSALSRVHVTAKEFLQQQGIEFDPRSPIYVRFNRLIHEAMLERDRRLFIRFDGARFALNPRFANLDASTEVNRGSAVTFAELIRQFEHSKNVEKRRASPKTALKWAAQKRLFLELIGGDTVITQITREKARAVFEAVSSLPSNPTKRFKGLTVQQVLQLPVEKRGKPIASATINSYLASFSALLKFAENEHLIEKTPAHGFQVANTGKRVKDQREPFSVADLKRIFDAPLYRGCKDDRAGYAKPGSSKPRRGRFWIPLISLYSGMRLNEVCQLSEDDICEFGGVPVFVVRPTPDGSKRVKTEAAERVVPIHPELRRLGLMTLVEATRMKKPAGSRLFPDVPVGSTSYASDPFSKWFARFLDHVAIVEPGKNFHSFRHNFKDAMSAAGVPEQRMNLLAGWSNKGMAARYGGSKEVEAAMLAQEIGKVQYAGLNLDHLLPAYSAQERLTARPAINSTIP